MIFRILRRNFPHGVAIREQARALWRVLEVGVQIANGRQVGPFPLRSYAHIPTAFRVLPPGLQLVSDFPLALTGMNTWGCSSNWG